MRKALSPEQLEQSAKIAALLDESNRWKGRRDWPSGYLFLFTVFLNRFVADLTEPIVAARGEIHSYVGDEVIATWKLEDGKPPARSVACFAAIDRLAEQAPDYRREFGAAISFRAGLHCGPVVTGEMGSVKKEIVFLGDTVNTAARIQELCRRRRSRHRFGRPDRSPPNCRPASPNVRSGTSGCAAPRPCSYNFRAAAVSPRSRATSPW